MKKYYASLETAKVLKEKGFKESCFARYSTLPSSYRNGTANYTHTVETEEWSFNTYDTSPHIIDDPELHKVQQWLREEHKVEIVIGIDVDFTWRDEDEDLTGESVANVMYYTYDICICNRWLMTNTISCADNKYTTYEQSLEAGIIEALKMI